MTIIDAPFSLLEDLPDGALVLEASAGTGKTFTLTALATRLIAETDITTADLLVVTFTRAATAELRDRLRERLVAAAHHLSYETPPDDADPLLHYLAQSDPETRRVQRERLEAAISEFDAATITTIHGFATQVLTTLGAGSGTDPDAALTDDDDALIQEACADVLVAAALEGHPVENLPTHSDVVNVTTARMSIPDLAVVPRPGQVGASAVAMLTTELVERAVEMVEERRTREATLSFDDILARLRTALHPGRPGQHVVLETLRNRFKAALIDEFQDTDPVQWAIFKTLFGDHDGTRLILVGDPKQAIYAFRGANVHTYLEAVEQSSDGKPRSLGTNWRSDKALLDALDVLLRGTTFGESDITFRSVGPADKHTATRIKSADGSPLPALRIRLALDPAFNRTKKRPHNLETRQVERAINRDLVGHVRMLLDGAQIPDDDGSMRPVRPDDIAVLVRTGPEATKIQRELIEQGIPAVLSRGSVLDSPAASHWGWLLEGLSRPSDPRRARTAALSWFGGLDADWVASASDDQLAEFQERLATWSETLTRDGVTAFVGRLWAETDVVARVLKRRDGDRAITDLEHIGEILQKSSIDGRSSVPGLIAVLASQPKEDPDADRDSDLVARRVESEADSVQIMTIWVAKGLEFPIVCCPSLWRSPKSGPTIYFDRTTGRRTIDTAKGKDWPDADGAAERAALAAQEAAGENLRLLYVALTRAKHQTNIWWTRVPNSAKSGLARVLFARSEGEIDPETFVEAEVPLPDDSRAVEFLEPIRSAGHGTISVEMHGIVGRPADRWTKHQPDAVVERPNELAVAQLTRELDRRARRWSFSAISRRVEDVHTDPYDSSQGDAGAADEASPTTNAAEETEAVESGTAPATEGLLARLPAGTAFGTFVHSLLEHLDFSDDELDETLRELVDEEIDAWGFDMTPLASDDSPSPTADEGAALLVSGLRAAIDTPMGPLLDERALSSFGMADRLNELDFQFVLGQHGGVATDRDIGDLVLRHIDDGDPLHPWAVALAGGLFDAELAGHLTGSIDAVLRVRRDGAEPRFVVVDYKTNFLRPPDGSSARPYAPDGLAEAMAHHHYPLQILLYSVALHRYLRWRLDGYDPSVHLGGAAYLFVRGMTGPAVFRHDGQPEGVFGWQVPPALVVELSDLLDRGRAALEAS